MDVPVIQAAAIDHNGIGDDSRQLYAWRPSVLNKSGTVYIKDGISQFILGSFAFFHNPNYHF